MRKNPKISIITVVKNGMPFLEDCLLSFKKQKYKYKELIVVYSKSEDNTLDILMKNKFIDKVIVDENSSNLYSSINKGILSCKGDLIGILHSDDIFYSDDILNKIAANYIKNKFDIGYGDIIISQKNNLSKVIRTWTSSLKSNKSFKYGWMPPHTSLFISHDLKNLHYSNKYSISSDYEYLIKVFKKSKKKVYFNFCTTIMRTGGLSNAKLFLKFKEDIQISKKYFKFNYIVILLKVIRKLYQFGSFNKSIKKNKYLINFFNSKYNFITNTNQIMSRKKFILSAFNMAFLAYVHNKISFNRKSLFLWPDGILSKLILKKKKIPGRKLLSQIDNNGEFKNVYLISSFNTKNIFYIKKKFSNKRFHFIEAPFGNSEIIFNTIKIQLVNIKPNSLILLGIPTPKQEEIASKISNILSSFKIICLGGAISYNSRETEIPPKFFETYFESIWRLQNDTFRRSSRLLLSILIFIKRSFFGEYKNM